MKAWTLSFQSTWCFSNEHVTISWGFSVGTICFTEDFSERGVCVPGKRALHGVFLDDFRSMSAMEKTALREIKTKPKQ